MTLQQFRSALVRCAGIVPCYHGMIPPEAANPVVAWNETGRAEFFADNAVSAAYHQIQIDYYTDTEYDPFPDQLRAALVDETVFGVGIETVFDPELGCWRHVISVEMVS